MYEDVSLRGKIKITSIDPYVNGDAGWDWANMYAVYDREGVKPFNVMFLFLFSKENGEWESKGEMYVIGEWTPENIKGQIYPNE